MTHRELTDAEESFFSLLFEQIKAGKDFDKDLALGILGRLRIDDGSVDASLVAGARRNGFIILQLEAFTLLEKFGAPFGITPDDVRAHALRISSVPPMTSFRRLTSLPTPLTTPRARENGVL